MPRMVGRKGLGGRMEGYRPGNEDSGMCQGMQEVQALLIPSCPSPSFTGGGSSSWEIPVPPSSLSLVRELGAEAGSSSMPPIGAEGTK